MSANRGFHDYVMEQLAALGCQSRPMFGGYGIYDGAAMFALIAGAALYFKVDDSNRDAFASAGSSQFMRMPYFEVPAAVLDDADELRAWAHGAITVGHATAKPKRGRGPAT